MKTLFSIFFIWLCFSVQGQINQPFIKHLSQNKLQREHWAYLQQLSGISDQDSIAYLKGKYYLSYPNDSMFVYFFQKSRRLFLSDSCALHLANARLLQQAGPVRENWFNSLAHGELSGSPGGLYDIYQAGADPLNYDENRIPPALRTDFDKLRNASGKKPGISAALSAAVPGLGKYYAGRKRSAVVTFVSHVIYGVQSYEVIRRLGAGHPFSIFSIGFFGIFYAGNVYGSYHQVHEVQTELREQLFINATNHYHINCSDR